MLTKYSEVLVSGGIRSHVNILCKIWLGKPAPIAQSVERGPYESKVESSSLPGSILLHRGGCLPAVAPSTIPWVDVSLDRSFLQKLIMELAIPDSKELSGTS